MKKLTQLFLVLGLIFTFNIGLLDTGLVDFGDSVTSEAYASGNKGVFQDSSKTVNANVEDGSDTSNLIDTITKIANTLAAIVLAVSVIMIIIGALRMIMANGNAQQAEQGKMILIYAGIGIIVALSAYALGRIFAGFGF